MITKRPKLFYVPDTPADEEVDVSKSKRISENEFQGLLKASKKTAKHKPLRKKVA